jgi:DNA mismatch repair ATPase MutL
LSQSVSAEANAVATVVEALALSRPDVGFSLRSDGRLLSIESSEAVTWASR